MNKYEPRPVDTSTVQLDAELLRLSELLAANAHDVWAARRIAEGWVWGPRRSDTTKQHPCLVPYESLPQSEQEYDRTAVLETIKMLITLGYQISKRA
jgi:RyR domain